MNFIQSLSPNSLFATLPSLTVSWRPSTLCGQPNHQMPANKPIMGSTIEAKPIAGSAIEARFTQANKNMAIDSKLRAKHAQGYESPSPAIYVPPTAHTRNFYTPQSTKSTSTHLAQRQTNSCSAKSSTSSRSQTNSCFAKSPQSSPRCTNSCFAKSPRQQLGPTHSESPPYCPQSLPSQRQSATTRSFPAQSPVRKAVSNGSANSNRSPSSMRVHSHAMQGDIQARTTAQTPSVQFPTNVLHRDSDRSGATKPQVNTLAVHPAAYSCRDTSSSNQLNRDAHSGKQKEVRSPASLMGNQSEVDEAGTPRPQVRELRQEHIATDVPSKPNNVAETPKKDSRSLDESKISMQAPVPARMAPFKQLGGNDVARGKMTARARPLSNAPACTVDILAMFAIGHVCQFIAACAFAQIIIDFPLVHSEQCLITSSLGAGLALFSFLIGGFCRFLSCSERLMVCPTMLVSFILFASAVSSFRWLVGDQSHSISQQLQIATDFATGDALNYAGPLYANGVALLVCAFALARPLFKRSGEPAASLV